MFKHPPLLLLALAFAAPAIAGESNYTESLESVRTLRIDGDIEIDGQGQVVSHTLDTELPAPLSTLVDNAVARWKFAPPIEDGKPLDRARSKMRIALVANEVEQDGKTGLVVKIDNVTFPPPPADPAKPAPPEPQIDPGKMPTVAISAHVVVTLHVQYDASGRILDVAPSQCTVLAMYRGNSTTGLCRKLERDSVSAVRGWKVANARADMDRPATGTLALVFNHRGPVDTVGEWRREQRSPYRAAPWEPVDAPRVGASDVGGSGLITRTSGLTLLEGIGKTL